MKDEKDLIQYKNGSKGKNPGQAKKNPGRNKKIFSSPKRPGRFWSPPNLRFLPGGKAAGS
jgi:hypothetical protein